MGDDAPAHRGCGGLQNPVDRRKSKPYTRSVYEFFHMLSTRFPHAFT